MPPSLARRPVNGGDANIDGGELEAPVSPRGTFARRPAAAGSTSSTPRSIRCPASRSTPRSRASSRTSGASGRSTTRISRLVPRSARVWISSMRAVTRPLRYRMRTAICRDIITSMAASPTGPMPASGKHRWLVPTWPTSSGIRRFSISPHRRSRVPTTASRRHRAPSGRSSRSDSDSGQGTHAALTAG